jgi:hypothetical protein
MTSAPGVDRAPRINAKPNGKAALQSRLSFFVRERALALLSAAITGAEAHIDFQSLTRR